MPPLDLAAARKVIAEYDTNDFREGCDEFMFARHAANGWPDALNAYEVALAEVERLTKELDELLAAVVDGPLEGKTAQQTIVALRVEIHALIDHEGVTLNAIARLEAERDAALLQSQAAEERAAGAEQHEGAMLKERSTAEQYAKDAEDDRDYYREHCKAAEIKTGRTETERDAYRSMLCDLLASAHPHPTEHPTMSKQWDRARELLKNGPAASAPTGEQP